MSWSIGRGGSGSTAKRPPRKRPHCKKLPGRGRTAKESPAVIMKSEVSLIASTAHDQKYIVKKIVTKKTLNDTPVGTYKI